MQRFWVICSASLTLWSGFAYARDMIPVGISRLDIVFMDRDSIKREGRNPVFWQTSLSRHPEHPPYYILSKVEIDCGLDKTRLLSAAIYVGSEAPEYQAYKDQPWDEIVPESVGAAEEKMACQGVRLAGNKPVVTTSSDGLLKMFVNGTFDPIIH